MSSTGLQILRAHYEQPLLAAKQAHSDGQRIVGLTGPTAPVELVLAAGLFPVRISPSTREVTELADRYMDAVISPDTKSLFESAMNGDFEFLQLLVLTRSEDKLYYYLKEMLRLGKGAKFPPLHMLDLMGSRREAVRSYNLQNLDWLLDSLQRASGHEITDSAIHSAIEQTNRCRALQRQLLALRWSRQLPGSDALIAIGAGFYMHPQSYADALQSYLADLAATRAPASSGPRVLVLTSEPLTHLTLHRRIEAAGAVVIAEDDEWGARAPGSDPPLAGSARESLFQKYWLDVAHPGVYPPQARESWLSAQLGAADLQGVIFYVPPSDRQFGWDYPRLAAQVKAAGKQSVLLRQDAKHDDSIDALISKFVAQLSGAGVSA